MKKLLFITLIVSHCFGGYGCKIPVILDHTQVNSNQLNFPVMVSGTLNTSHVTNNLGYDVNFFKDAGCSVAMKWEMQSYKYSTGAFVAWPKRDTVHHTVNDTFYACYNNSAITTFQGDSLNAAPPNSVGWWHLGDSLNASDAAGNSNGIDTGIVHQVTGPFASADSFTGSASFIHLGTNASLAQTGDITISFWLNPTDNSTFRMPFSKGASTSDNWDIFLNPAGGANNKMAFYRGPYVYISTHIFSYQVWTYVNAVFTGNRRILYYNGVFGDSGSGAGSSVTETGQTAYIGTRTGRDYLWKGREAEVRLYNTSSLTSDQFSLEYNNQKPGQTFSSLGTESCTGAAPPRRGWVF